MSKKEEKRAVLVDFCKFRTYWRLEDITWYHVRVANDDDVLTYVYTRGKKKELPGDLIIVKPSTLRQYTGRLYAELVSE